jgi:diphthamide biosynthesis methyltransferase
MLGLSPYRFGETVTIGKWQENYKPYLWIGKIERNLRSSLHTICLIDPLISEGSELLYIINKAIEKYKEEKKKKILRIEKIEKVFFIKNAFCKNEEIDYLPLNEIYKKNVKNATIVFPSMTRLEESFVSILFGK